MRDCSPRCSVGRWTPGCGSACGNSSQRRRPARSGSGTRCCVTRRTRGCRTRAAGSCTGSLRRPWSAAPGSAAGRAGQLSLHYFHAQRYAAASHYARIAGERAAAVYANAEAAEFLATALDAAKQAGQSAADLSRLAEALGDIRYRLGDFRAADHAFAEARKSIDGDPVALARLCEKTALVVARTSGVSSALRWTARGREALVGLTDADAERQDALLLRARTLLRYRQGRYAEAAATAAEAIAVAQRCGARDVLARALYLLDAADVARGWYRGEPWAEQALAIFKELGDLSWQAQALNVLGNRSYFEGCWDDALGYYRQAGEAFERAGDQWNAAITACNAVRSCPTRAARARQRRRRGPPNGDAPFGCPVGDGIRRQCARQDGRAAGSTR